MRAVITSGAHRLSKWAAPSINRRIFVAAFTVGGFTLLVKSCAVSKEMISAFQFGTGRELDALLIAWALPTFFINVLGGSLQAALVPIYLDVLHKDGREATTRLIGSLSVVYALFLLIISLCLLSSSGWLIRGMGSGFTSAELALCRHVFYLLLPIIIFTGVARLYGGILVAENHFAVTTLATVATPLLSIVCMLLFTNAIGIYSLAVGILFGALIEMALLIWMSLNKEIPLSFRWGGWSPSLTQIYAQYLPMVAGAMVLAGTLITDQAMAAMLPAGGVSTLNYGNKVPALILGLTSAAIGTAVLPYFSRMVAAMDWEGVRHTFRTYFKLILMATIPATVLLMFLSKPVIHYLFERGSFSSADTELVSRVQICLLLQVPFYTLSILAVRLISALQANRTLLWGAAISLVLNVILNYIFMQLWGVAGIALSTSIVYMVSMAYLLYMSKHLLDRRERLYGGK